MTDAQHTPPRKGRGLRWVLGISLALNLVFIGVFAGAALRHVRDDGPSKWRDRPPQTYGGPLARSLPRAAQRDLRRALRGQDADLPSRAERQAYYARMLETLRAETFDRATAEEILTFQSTVASRVQTRAQDTWLTLVAAMSTAERRAVADRLEEALRRPRRKHHKPAQDG